MKVCKSVKGKQQAVFGAEKSSQHLKIPREEAHSLGRRPSLGRPREPFLWGRDTGLKFKCFKDDCRLQDQRNCYMKEGYAGYDRPRLAGLVCFMNESCKSKTELAFPMPTPNPAPHPQLACFSHPSLLSLNQIVQ